MYPVYPPGAYGAPPWASPAMAAAAAAAIAPAPAGNDNSPATPARKPRKHYTATKTREMWSAAEHERMLDGLRRFQRDWTRVTAHVGTRSAAQVRSHAQKYFDRVAREKTDEWVPQARPKRRSAVPYPRKALPAPEAADLPEDGGAAAAPVSVALPAAIAAATPPGTPLVGPHQAGAPAAASHGMWQAQAAHAHALHVQYIQAQAHGYAQAQMQATAAAGQSPQLQAAQAQAAAQAAAYARAYRQYLACLGAQQVYGQVPMVHPQQHPSTPNLYQQHPYLVSSPVGFEGASPMHVPTHGMSPHLGGYAASPLAGLPTSMYPAFSPMSQLSFPPPGSSPFLQSPFPFHHPQAAAAAAVAATASANGVPSRLCPHGNGSEPGACPKCSALQRHGNVLTNLYAAPEKAVAAAVEADKADVEQDKQAGMYERSRSLSRSRSRVGSGSGSGSGGSGTASGDDFKGIGSGIVASGDESASGSDNNSNPVLGAPGGIGKAGAALHRAHRASVIRARRATRKSRVATPGTSSNRSSASSDSYAGSNSARPFKRPRQGVEAEAPPAKRARSLASSGDGGKQAEIDAVHTLQILSSSNAPTSPTQSAGSGVQMAAPASGPCKNAETSREAGLPMARFPPMAAVIGKGRAT